MTSPIIELTMDAGHRVAIRTEDIRSVVELTDYTTSGSKIVLSDGTSFEISERYGKLLMRICELEVKAK